MTFSRKRQLRASRRVKLDTYIGLDPVKFDFTDYNSISNRIRWALHDEKERLKLDIEGLRRLLLLR